VKKDAIWLDRILFENPCFVGLCITEKQFKNTLKRMTVPENKWPDFPTKGATVHYFEKEGLKTRIVCKISEQNKHSKTSTMALLVHEAVHIWREVKKQIGEEHASSEFEAYGIQNISQSLFEAYNKLTGGK